KVLLADRGYDVNHVVDTACAGGIKVVIPSKRSRKVVRTYDTELYKKRHLIEMYFGGSNSTEVLLLAMLNALIPFLSLSISDLSSFLLTTPPKSDLAVCP
ncbi:MAG: hypothetical protein LBO67_05785, partial [Spirochaetaceae bacterium]|nr:hypothetical protein [Spirochaetaceae bacterium]